MAFSHLEQLISEYLEWTGFLIKRNIKVGRLTHGGWEMELDIIGYHPSDERLVQYEPSIDALSWEKRKARYEKKFTAGQKYIKSELFKWIKGSPKLEQYAVFVSHPKNRHEIAGGRILSIDELMKQIKDDVFKAGIMGKNAVPESYPFLRTIQLTLSGYYRVL
jgi:hypothetical protein